MERVNILESRKAIEDCLEFFSKSFCGELDFASVESWLDVSNVLLCFQNFITSYSRYLEAGAYLCGQSPLGSTEDDVDELLRGWHRRNLYKKLAIRILVR